MKKAISLFNIVFCLFLTVKAQHPLDNYLNATVTFKVINSSGDSVYMPKDLDFKPGTYELWVLCRNKGGSGMGTVTFYEAGQSGQKSEFRQDSHHAHFLKGSTGIAWGTNGNFATVQCVETSSKDWMGPTLWPGDTSIYAREHQNDGMLGSHLDMLHQTTTGRGIAHEKDNVYWVYDDISGDICRYDFAVPHEVGGDDHSDGKIRRYTQVQVSGETAVPAHMIIDTAGGWLYFADTGNDRIIRLNINSGEVNQPMSPYAGEPLIEYVSMKNVQWEVYIDSGLVRPSGIDYYDGRLIVGDYANGDIILYNTNASKPVEMGRIHTGSGGLMGLKVGPDGHIWYVDYKTHKVMRIEHAPLGVPVTSNYSAEIYPNPSTGTFKVAFSDEEMYNLELFNVQGQLVYSEDQIQNSSIINSSLPAGLYIAKFTNDARIIAREVVIKD